MESEQTSAKQFVYGLLDTQSGRIFYVGITNNPGRRLYQHKYVDMSDAHDRCCEVVEAGFEVDILILRECESRDEARFIEAQLHIEYAGRLVSKPFGWTAESSPIRQVITALGGIQRVCEIARAEYKTVSGWQGFRSYFPANTYVVLQHALKKRGMGAPPELWNMIPIIEADQPVA